MARIVVTGGAGFLGSHSATRCSAAATRSSVVDNLVTGSTVNIEHLFGAGRFRFVRHDVSEYIWVPGEVDAVMHFASPASPIDYLELPDPDPQGRQPRHPQRARPGPGQGRPVHARLHQRGLRRPAVHPQPETYWGNVNPIGPRGVYDEAKRFAEAITMAYHRDPRPRRPHRAHLQHLRARACGPDDGRVVSNFIVQALKGEPLTIYGDGTQTRSFCYVDDEVRGFLALLDGDHTGPINIGNDGEFTMLELAEVVLEVTGSSSPIEYRPLPVDDPKQRRPDLTLARGLLGWEPTIALREGVTRTTEYFRGLLDAGEI